MNLKKEFDSVILPVIKGLPITIILVVIAIAVTKRSIQYATPEYQAHGAIKIDNRDFNLPAFNMNDKSAMISSNSSNNLMTELEIFKSRKLIEACYKNLDFNVSYFRVGKIKSTELYHDSPFTITPTVSNQDYYGRLIYLEYLGDDQFAMREQREGMTKEDTVRFHNTWMNNDFSITLNENKSLLAEKKPKLQVGDLFSFQINSLDDLVEDIGEKNLFIKAVDKDVSIIKIYYTDPVPAKAQAFTNTLMQTYIEESNTNVSQQGKQALGFVNEQLKSTIEQLSKAEEKLSTYKAQNGIINSKQETDASLKEMVQLDIQRVGFELKEIELKRLYDFLASGKSLQDFSPNFEALKDPIFRENYIKAQNFELQKKDLLIKFTEQSEEVTTIIAKLNQIRSFLNESVNNTLKNIQTNKSSLSNAMNEITINIKDYPDKEREITVLEREVKLKEQLYTYLAEKKAELAIANASKNSFHTIIDSAKIPTREVWPNKPLAYGLSVFMALLFGLFISYLLHFLFARVKDKKQLSLLTKAPILSSIQKIKVPEQIQTAYASLHTSLEILRKDTQNQKPIISISSLQGKEGKTLTAVNLASSIASSGKKVLLIDMDIRKPNTHLALELDNNIGLSDIIEKSCLPQNAIQRTSLRNLDALTAGKLHNIFPAIIYSEKTIQFIQSLQEQYDYIIIDVPPITEVVEVMPLLHKSSINLLLLKAGFSKIRILKNLDPILEDLKIPNLYLVLNNIKSTVKRYKHQKTKKVNFKFTFNQSI